MVTDVLIAGSGCSGLYAALNLPKDKKILIITKKSAEESNSFLAQGGICVLNGDDDFDSFFNDTLKAGHNENDKNHVSIMINSSREIINDLVSLGVDFTKKSDGSFDYTKEGAHSKPRILYHKDITGKEITTKLLQEVRRRSNITLMEHTTLIDIITENNRCYGGIIEDENKTIKPVFANYVVLATGGIGGLFKHSTNYPHLTGDSLGMALKHCVETKNLNYIQIHPTTLYSPHNSERSFLISESIRGEGAYLYDKNKERFTNELLPRDILTNEIFTQMKKDETEFVWEDLSVIPEKTLKEHFPNIVNHCSEKGFDPLKEPVPVVPAQHYFMGGIKVNSNSKTSMENLYAVGETACNGVHGRNRLASNSLLESLVFAKRSAIDISNSNFEKIIEKDIDLTKYNKDEILKEYKKSVLNKIDMLNKEKENV